MIECAVLTFFDVGLDDEFLSCSVSANHADEGKPPRFGTHATVREANSLPPILSPPGFSIVGLDIVHFSQMNSQTLLSQRGESALRTLDYFRG